jgi:anti-sigma regulatory factor (Ser/Thr protein kinase)
MDDLPFLYAAREEAAGMASTARANEATEDLSVTAGETVLAVLTIPGRPEHVSEARAFVAKALGELHRCLDTAVLLTSELVTNAVMHSSSRCAGGTVSVLIAELPGGLRIEVADDGSDLSSPVVRGDVYASDGHGLFLVQALADHWGYLREDNGTVVWFWLCQPATP